MESLRPLGDIVGLSNYDVRISRCGGGGSVPWMVGLAYMLLRHTWRPAWPQSQLFDIIVFINPERVGINSIIDNVVAVLNPYKI